MGRDVSRLPIRLRVTLAFAAVMAVVLGATGGFLYLRMASELNATIDRGLRSRVSDLTALVRESDSGLAQSRQLGDDDVAQILAASGTIIDSPSGLHDRPLLNTGAAQRAAHRSLVMERNEMRLLASPVRGQDGVPAVIVVGASTEDRTAALSSLATLLLLGGTCALLLASLAGYGVAAAALRPVEAMRRRAGEIQGGAPGQRLPVGRARDELRRLGETLNAMLARLEAALARERTFVADASHELRTPLAILKGELELARKRRRSRDELEDAVRSAEEETDRLAQLAEDLLVIARADQGELPLRRERVAAAELLARVRGRFAVAAEKRGAELRVDAPDAVWLDVDGLRMEQVLGNLVDNALRHGAGPVVLRARVGELSVRDHGPGFANGYLGAAFERFSRGDPARSGPGAGLGLAIVAAIANAHGGAASASNADGGGAEVRVTFPPGG
jgi:two-component system OmpR family sensor kinase